MSSLNSSSDASASCQQASPSASHKDSDETASSGGKGKKSFREKPRDRAVHVCLNCRRRKRKCDQQKPVCGQCKSAKQEDRCEWDPRRDTVRSSKKYLRKSRHAKLLRENHRTILESTATFSTRTVFEITVEKAGTMNDLLSTPGMTITELYLAYDVWNNHLRSTACEDTPLPNHLFTTDTEGLGLIDVFLALSTFAHATVYLNYNTATTLSVFAGRVTLKAAVMLMPALARGDAILTPQLAGALSTLVRQVEYYTPEERALLVPVYNDFYSLLKLPMYGPEAIPDYYTALCGCIFYGTVGDPIALLQGLIVERRQIFASDPSIVCDGARLRAQIVSSVFTLEVFMAVMAGARQNHNNSSLTFQPSWFHEQPPGIQQLFAIVQDDITSTRDALVALSQAIPDCSWLNWLAVNSNCSVIMAAFLCDQIEDSHIELAKMVFKYIINDRVSADHPFNTTVWQLFIAVLRVMVSFAFPTFCEMVYESKLLDGVWSDTVLSSKGKVLRNACHLLLSMDSPPATEQVWMEIGLQSAGTPPGSSAGDSSSGQGTVVLSDPSSSN